MSLLTASRTAQSPLVAEYTFTFGDTAVDTAGAAVDYASASAATVMVIPLPPGSTVTGGSVDTPEAWTAAVTVDVGDVTVPDRYTPTPLAAGGLGAKAITPTGYLNVAGENIQMTITPAGTQAVGKTTVRIEYVVEGRSCEVQVA